jgi:hypothetical protein
MLARKGDLPKRAAKGKAESGEIPSFETPIGEADAAVLRPAGRFAVSCIQRCSLMRARLAMKGTPGGAVPTDAAPPKMTRRVIRTSLSELAEIAI